MGVLKVKVQPVITGPIADGAATSLTTEWATRTTQALGEEAVTMLRAFPMNKSGRATGAFQGALQVTRRSPTETRVTGPQQRGAVWSSWLEGTSTRNQGSKFKGYRLFRKTRLALDKMAPAVGQKVLDELLPQVGGA